MEQVTPSFLEAEETCSGTDEADGGRCAGVACARARWLRRQSRAVPVPADLGRLWTLS